MISNCYGWSRGQGQLPCEPTSRSTLNPDSQRAKMPLAGPTDNYELFAWVGLGSSNQRGAVPPGRCALYSPSGVPRCDGWCERHPLVSLRPDPNSNPDANPHLAGVSPTHRP
jgi:hypothetical protein